MENIDNDPEEEFKKQFKLYKKYSSKCYKNVSVIFSVTFWIRDTDESKCLNEYEINCMKRLLANFIISKCGKAIKLKETENAENQTTKTE